MFGVTTAQPQRGPCDWAYCTREDAAGRWPVGYVQATNERDAKKKAQAKAERITAATLGFKNITAMRQYLKDAALRNGGRKPKGYSRRCYVWRDNDHECAPESVR